MPTILESFDWEHAQRLRTVVSDCCSSAKTGVYMIRNNVNGKVYIGSSALCIFHRVQEHLRCLRSGKHHNIHLQSSWNKHGEDQFDFEVLCECSPGQCIELEQRYIDETQSYDRRYGYNLSPTAASTLGMRLSEATISKLREARKNISSVTRERMRIAAKARPPMSQETRDKVSAAGIGRIQSEETRLKRSRTLTGKPKKLTVPRIERTCPICTRPFIVKEYGKGSEKYICSEQCRKESMKRDNPQRFRQRVLTVSRLCRLCNGEFTVKITSKVQFCSEDCVSQWRRDFAF